VGFVRADLASRRHARADAPLDEHGSANPPQVD